MDKKEFLRLFGRMENDYSEEKAIFRTYIKNKNVPLDDRWDVFAEAPNSWVGAEGWNYDFDCVPEITWFDDFHIERMQTVDFIDIMSRIEENIEAGFSKNERVFTGEDVVNMKEELLEKNVRAFVYDW